MIESSPQLNHELMAKAVPLMNKPEVRELVDEINEIIVPVLCKCVDCFSHFTLNVNSFVFVVLYI